MSKVYIALQRHTSEDYIDDMAVAINLGVYDNVEDARKRVTESANEKKEWLEKVSDSDTPIGFEDNGNGYIEISMNDGFETFEFFVDEYELNKPAYDQIA